MKSVQFISNINVSWYLWLPVYIKFDFLKWQSIREQVYIKQEEQKNSTLRYFLLHGLLHSNNIRNT